MNINERIKLFRKEILQINQKQFASALGFTQSGVSYMEQSGSTIADNSIKIICTMYNLSEDWLRYGIEPMYIHPPTFSLDDFAKQCGATELELSIIKAYFELEPEVRKKLVQHFKERLPYDGIPNTAAELEKKYPPIEGYSEFDVSNSNIG